MKQNIRLKSYAKHEVRQVTPPANVLELSDSSIGAGPFELNTDAHGFISTGNNLGDDSDPAIVLVGGSFVESALCEEGNRFASQLERLLYASGQRFRILNAGYSGMTTLHQILLVMAKFGGVLPAGSRIIHFIGQSDENALSSDGLYWNSSPTLTPVQPPLNVLASSREPEQTLESLVHILLESSRSLGFRPYLVASPFRNGDFSWDAVLRKTYRRDRERYNKSLALRMNIIGKAGEVAKLTNTPFLDAQDIFATNPEYFYDLMHVNNDGQNAFASTLRDWLEKVIND
jgi:lysophospholipase L1-like esterase